MKDDEQPGIPQLEVTAEIAEAVINGIDNLSILARIKIAHNMLFYRDGDKTELPHDPVNVVVTEILADCVRLLSEHPRLAKIGERQLNRLAPK